MKDRNPAFGKIIWWSDRATNDQIIDRTMKRVSGITAHRRSDPKFVIVNDGGPIGGAAHVPCSFHQLSIDVTTNRFWTAESIRHRDVVPVPVGTKSGLAGPAMPIGGMSVAFLAAEEKTGTGVAFDASQTQRVVLIVGRPVKVSATLADDVNVLPAADAVEPNPGFDRNRIVLIEIQITVFAVIRNSNEVTVSVQPQCPVGFRHALEVFGDRPDRSDGRVSL